MEMSSRSEWAPPPPVLTPGRPTATPPPPPQVRQQPKNPEAEFEATLGNLVEHFTTMPPAVYGEPPDLSMADVRPRRRQTSIAWVWIGSLAAGAVLAGAGLVGFQLMRTRQSPPATPVVAAPAVTPEVKIVVTNPTAPIEEEAEPQAEPLAEEAVATAPTAAAAVPAATETATPAPVKKSRKVKAPARRSRPAPAAPHGSPAGEDGWDDPYK